MQAGDSRRPLFCVGHSPLPRNVAGNKGDRIRVTIAEA
jgi:hypothetical protein